MPRPSTPPGPRLAAFDTPPLSPQSHTTTLATLQDGADVEKSPSTDEKDVGDLQEVPGEGKADEEHESVPTAPPPFPDGGRRAYLNTCGGVLVLLSTFGASNGWAVFQAHLAANQLKDYTPSAISWIGSVQLFALFILGLPSGRLFDSGHFRAQLAVGSVLWCFGMYMLSLSKTYYQIFLSWAVCQGLALGILFAGTLSCVGSYFKRKRTVMMGCTAGGAALGAVVFPIALNHLFETHGFAFAVRLIAYLHTGLLILANLLMRPRDDIPPRKPPPVAPQIVSFLRQPQTWFASLGCSFVMLGMFIPIFYVQIFVKEHGASETVVQYAAAILNGSACLARVTVGFAADRWGNLTVALPTTLLMAAVIFAMLGVSDSAGAVAFCVVFGIASGAWVTIMAPSLISLSASVREFGVRSGVGFLFVSVAALIGSPVAGAILRATPSSTGTNYTGVCVFGGCAVLIGTAFLSATWWLQLKRKGTWRV
ncbi:major facilitator superfamily domain-containing protein [Rhodotorula diobovata]|uniref:Major facilitator superfamily domain-containing protein n=1 Tax=Rhodotorula diobovata TaxID=5288 RepID=A0A5C5FWW1_9BASI|nr:major facilitator superfamily domain-containing protein [Rhodotorula diobovata]